MSERTRRIARRVSFVLAIIGCLLLCSTPLVAGLLFPP
jgi:hypothetical protein